MIGPGCVVEEEARIGADTVLHALVFVGARCVVGERCEIHPHTTLGSDGYGFAQDELGHHHKVPQLGIVVVEDDVEIQSNCAIDRGAFSETRIGRGTKIDNLCHIAHNCQIGEDVALKTLLGASARDPKAIERFRQEARAASKIGSPFICDVTDFGTLPDGQVFYVMEYIDGPSLRRVLDVDTFVAAPRAIAILRQICKALGAAHEKGIIHLDVKPDNILVLEDGTPRLLDFGTAKLLGPLPEASTAGEFTRLGLQAFTPSYASPEQVLGESIRTASDTYSLGVLLFLLLAEVPPYALKDGSTAELLRIDTVAILPDAQQIRQTLWTDRRGEALKTVT